MGFGGFNKAESGGTTEAIGAGIAELLSMWELLCVTTEVTGHGTVGEATVRGRRCN